MSKKEMRTNVAVKTLTALFVGALLLGANFSTATVHAQGNPPVLTSFSPTTDTNGAPVTIRGENLLNVTSVKFNGVEASFTEFSNTRLFAVVPDDAETGPITVTTLGGTTTSADVFTVINVNAPGITGLSPLEGKPGTSVQIDGTNLVTATSVKFNGVDAAFVVNAGVLFATVPTQATSGPITVVTPEGTAASADSFTVLKSETAPVISDFKPKSGEAGATIQVSGQNLSAVTAVTFNGVPASFRLFAGILIATVPANATTGLIAVSSPSGTDTSGAVFTVIVQPPPAITGFNPSSGPPGTSVTIEGNNFVNVTAVRFGGVNASFQVFGASLLATVPANAATGPVTVATATGSVTTTSIFTVTEVPKPVISGFDPASGEPGAQIQVQGSNLADATSVRFNGLEAQFNVLAGSLLATVPTNAASGPISITTPAGTATSANSFTVLEPSTVTSISGFSPTSGPVGTTVEIRGTNFNNVTAVKFNGTDAVFTNVFEGLISAIVPTNATTGPIAIFSAASTNVTATPFTVTEPEPEVLPIVSSFSPANGVAGASVQIRGSTFVDVIAVRFNGIEATFTVRSEVEITATVPPGAVTGPITVTTAAGTAASATSFEITSGPVTPPTISVRKVAPGQLEISWPDAAKDFVLQENGNVGNASAWSTIQAPAVHSEGTFRSTVTVGVGPRFYRLFHP